MKTGPVQASDVTFGSVVNLSNDPVASGLPRIAAAGNNVYVAWPDNTFANADILFRASTNNGSSFGSIINLSNTPTGDSENPQVVAVGSNVYVVWQDNATGNNDIMFRASANNGASFGSVTNLSNDARDSSVPEVAALGNNVYVVWQTATTRNPDILFRASVNNGASFGSVTNLSNNPSSTSLTPQIAATGIYVYVTWRDNNPGNSQTFFARSLNNGTSFASAFTLNNSPAGETDLNQEIAAAGNNVYVTWTNDTLTTDNTMFVASTSNGASFGPSINLNKGAGIDLNPELAASGSNVYVVWSDEVGGNTEVFYRTSANNGASFGSIVNLSNTPGTSNDQTIAAAGSRVYVTWVESGTGNGDIFFVSSSDGGATFGSPANLSNNTGFSVVPVVEGVGNNVYVAWQDDTVGNDEVFFRVGTPPPDIAVSAVSISRSFAYFGVNSQPVKVNVTVANLGPVGETFTVIAEANATLPNSTTIGTMSLTLTAGASRVVSFNWNTTLLARGHYIVSGRVPSVPGEVNLSNNQLALSGVFEVRKPGDANDDGAVDIFDAAMLGYAYGSRPSDHNWISAVDFDNNGVIDMFDAVTLGRNYHSTS